MFAKPGYRLWRSRVSEEAGWREAADNKYLPATTCHPEGERNCCEAELKAGGLRRQPPANKPGAPGSAGKYCVLICGQKWPEILENTCI